MTEFLICYMVLGLMTLWVGERKNASMRVAAFTWDECLIVFVAWWIILLIVVVDEIKHQRRQ